ncbi:MAG: NAD(+)/NADH kinase [Desulfosarcina sp.]|nr:NAD(+)/NADH kinase [Desulfosarcina sp.]
MKKHIGLVVKDEDNARQQADRFERWLVNKGLTVIRRQIGTPGGKRSEGSRKQAPKSLSCVFVLGGDGTFLSAVRWIGDQQIPIIGVKFGEVGFLAETTEDRLCEVAEAILEDQFTIRPQMRLQVQALREGVEIARESAFNDVVINKGALARLARIRTHIDDQFLTDYRADGLIVATNRPLMVPDSATIKIQLAEDTSDIMLTCDGQVGLKIDDRDTIIISKSPSPVQMITLPDQNYFDVLKAKLKWSGGRV